MTAQRPACGSGEAPVTDLPSLLIGVALANYFVLVPLITAQRLREASALPAGLATLLALVPAAALTWAAATWLLQPLDFAALGLLSALLAAIAMTPPATRLTRLAATVGMDTSTPGLALTAVNSGLINMALWVTGKHGGLASALFWGAAAGIGFLVIMVLFAGLRERLEAEEVPRILRGPAIALVTAGFFSLALGGIGSIIRG